MIRSKPLSALTVPVLALAVLAGACTSPGGGAGGSNDGVKGQGSSNRNVNPAGSPIQREFSEVPGPAPLVAERTPQCIEAFAQAPQSTPPEGESFVIASIDPSRGMGPNCRQLAPGSDCQVPFNGGWRLAETPTGSMVFQVFENDSTIPIRSPEVGPVPANGRFSQSTRLHYKVSPTAVKATFLVVLKDATGRVAARSEPQTVSLPACFGTE